MTVHELTDSEEFDDLIKSNNIVVVDFFATWCGPCKIMGPKFHVSRQTYYDSFQKMAGEFPNVVFIKIDVDESEEVVSRYDIKVMPTFIFLKHGKQVDVVEGNMEDQLREKIAHHSK